MEKITEKIALFELGTTSVRLTLAMVYDSECFFVYKELTENINIDEHIEGDGLVKSAKIKEVVMLLQMYKKICEAEGVDRYLAVASNMLTNAKNYKSFVDEAGAGIALEFKVLSAQDEVDAVYTSVINTLDVPKGIIVNVSGHSTRIINYNRRVIIDSATIPFGSASLLAKCDNNIFKAIETFKAELGNHASFLSNMDLETTLVGVSGVFTSFGRISRKMKKINYDADHNFTTDAAAFGEVFTLIKGLDPEKRQKLKGISSQSSAQILCGMCIVEAVLQFSKLKNITVGCCYRNLGIIFKEAVPYTQERPVSDILSFCLETISCRAGLDRKIAERHYALALMLFKQLKVLHKLPRGYAKILRIACSLYQIGQRTNCEGFERNNLWAILNAPFMGAAHREVVLAAFVSSFKRWEDFNLAEWVKYKELIGDEEIESVRKISTILTIADALNIRNSDTVKDINCDILGDSVILKLVTETDTKVTKVDVKAANIEIFYAKKYSAEFAKAFKKNLEIL